MKNSNDTIGNRTRDLTVCSAVPQPTALPRAPSKENGLDVNADNAKCLVMSRDQNARRSHSIEIDNSSFETVEQFRCLGTTELSKLAGQ